MTRAAPPDIVRCEACSNAAIGPCATCGTPLCADHASIDGRCRACWEREIENARNRDGSFR